MVNVHAAIPFNLHNQARPNDPSGSRSASGSTRRFPAAQRDSQLYASRDSSLSSEENIGYIGGDAVRGKPLNVRLVGGGRARGTHWASARRPLPLGFRTTRPSCLFSSLFSVCLHWFLRPIVSGQRRRVEV